MTVYIKKLSLGGGDVIGQGSKDMDGTLQPISFYEITS